MPGFPFLSVAFSSSDSLASFSREKGPKVVRGDPAKVQSKNAVPAGVPQKVVAPTRPYVSDSSLKQTHVLYNLSPGGKAFRASLFKQPS